MNRRNRFLPWALAAVAGTALAFAHCGAAQTQPTPPAPTAAPTEKDVVDTQEQLLRLLRLSPTLTAAVAADPTLLADQQYVARNNPELAQFLVRHPEVARNPDFYLFSNLDSKGVRRDKALERVIWPEIAEQSDPGKTYMDYRYSPAGLAEHITGETLVTIGFLFFLGALIWLIRTFAESRRWNRTFNQQSELHTRLIDKFGTSQELAAYLESEAGKRFLMASPIAPGAESGQRMPNTVSRVLTSLSCGIVLALLGVGFLLLRNAGPDTPEPMLITGTLLLMPGLGFILSAGVTWVLAHRLGLMPEKEVAETKASAPFGSQDRQ